MTTTLRAPSQKKRRSPIRLNRRDRVALTMMVGIPTFIHVMMVWVPAISSILLSFTKWDGIGGFKEISKDFVGTKNYRRMWSIDPAFRPALWHNVLWMLVLLFFATTFGLLLAVLLDRNVKGSRLYQSAFYMPVVLSLALVGFMWDHLIYSPGEGLINSVLGRTAQGNQIDWIGDPKKNIWAVLIAASWRHAGYIMVLYLAGLKGVDPSLREAAAIDGASAWQSFRRVVFPALKPINIVVLVVTIIEGLRAFDLVFVINKGRNGLELLSSLITNTIIGESSQVGYGSALGVVLLLISLGFIITYLWNVFRSEQ